jgi:hypothetical protein
MLDLTDPFPLRTKQLLLVSCFIRHQLLVDQKKSRENDLISLLGMGRNITKIGHGQKTRGAENSL